MVGEKVSVACCRREGKSASTGKSRTVVRVGRVNFKQGNSEGSNTRRNVRRMAMEHKRFLWLWRSHAGRREIE
jgi:hypothetical protein